MADDVSDIRDYYDRSVEDEDLRLLTHQLEFDMTLKYLDEFLPKSARILEIGAATGRYTVELAKRGHSGTAVDLSPILMARCADRLRDAGVLGWETRVADVRDLDDLEGEFDTVLMMGPLYHLLERGDRAHALMNARTRLKPRGLIFTAWISRLALLGDLLKNVPTWVDDHHEVAAVMADGRNDSRGRRPRFRGYFARVEEIEATHEELGFDTVALAGVEPGIASYDTAYNELTQPLRLKWLDLLYRFSREPTTIGASRHLLYIGQKAT